MANICEKNHFNFGGKSEFGLYLHILLQLYMLFKIHLQKLFLFFCELRERNLAHQNQEASKPRDPQNTLTTDAICLIRLQIQLGFVAGSVIQANGKLSF